MQTAELFCGTKSFSKVAAAHNHKTLTFECEEHFNPDHRVDILKMPSSLVPYGVDVLWWASPPCQAFSVAAWGQERHARYRRGSGAKSDYRPTTSTVRWVFCPCPSSNHGAGCAARCGNPL